ncbi:mitochondrial import inner membrane translocase subunit Tim10 [Galendromus occidentalis]|uniref:Mitochondrial import inner membrane translocase subunit n=1 Tax=Galendromus occidentalis TaxID=34638 RepID=A0AAJ6QUQ8_9ACAR|nr:mitochondrial import inner membrane translocase subunit Tim10 [Galendromus occidentalis]
MAAGMQLDPSKLALVQELEIDMMADMYNRMTNVCQRKCIPTKYREGDLTKGESVCIDRCVAKFLDIHERIGKKLASISMQDEEAMKKMQQQQEASAVKPK